MPLVLQNVGAGPVEYSVRIGPDQPWAFLMRPGVQSCTDSGERRLGPGEIDNGLRVGVKGGEIPEWVDAVVVEVVSSDQGGESPQSLRPWVAQRNRWRRWRLRVPVQRLRAPDVRLSRGLVIFTARQREVSVRVSNSGGAPVQVQVENLPGGLVGSWQPPGYESEDDDLDIVLLDDDRPVVQAVDPVTLEPGTEADLLLQAEDAFEGTHLLVVRSDDGVRRELWVYGEPTEQDVALVKHWTVGLDFGTAKTAVYLTDNWTSPERREPQAMLWPAGPDDPERTAVTTRSAVMYVAGAGAPLCGHRVPVSAGAEGPHERVVERMKTLLRGDQAAQAITLPDGRQVSPVDVLADFLWYVLGELRDAPPFRGRTSLDARFVLTLPVMESRRMFLDQRERTLEAARKAGFPVEEVATPGEAECAALDLMHSLQRGDYTFEGKVYHLQDKEVILVFDCGAGTTDVAVLRVRVSEGKFGTEQLAAAGYRFGGDMVDDLLLSLVLSRRVSELRFEDGERGPVLVLPDVPRLPLYAAREECRRIKESLFLPGGSRDARKFHTDLGSFELRPMEVAGLVAHYLEAILTGGIMPDPRRLFPALDARLTNELRKSLWREMVTVAGVQVRPLAQVLQEAGLDPGAITFLFVTGGTGQIWRIPERVYEFLGRGARVVVATPEECTINVARGASLYYEYRMSGVLRCAVDVVGRDPSTRREVFRQRACAPESLPGPELECAVRIGPRQALEVALVASYPHGPSGDIAARIVRNSAPEPRELVITTEYRGDRSLHWRAAFSDGRVVISQEAVLQV